MHASMQSSTHPSLPELAKFPVAMECDKETENTDDELIELLTCHRPAPQLKKIMLIVSPRGEDNFKIMIVVVTIIILNYAFHVYLRRSLGHMHGKNHCHRRLLHCWKKIQHHWRKVRGGHPMTFVAMKILSISTVVKRCSLRFKIIYLSRVCFKNQGPQLAESYLTPPMFLRNFINVTGLWPLNLA